MLTPRAAPLDLRMVGTANAATAPAQVATGRVLVPARPVLLPPLYFPYAGSRRVFGQSSATVALASPAQVASFTLLSSEIGVLSDVEIGISNMLVSTVAAWAVRFNGGPVQWGPLSLIPRAATYAGDAWTNLGVPIPVGVTTVAVWASVADAGTYLMGASITGWAWPVELEAAVREGRAG